MEENILEDITLGRDILRVVYIIYTGYITKKEYILCGERVELDLCLM